MVVFEAAKALCELSEEMEGYSISHAFTCMNLFLASDKSTYKFAAIKTINHFAVKHA